MLKLTIFCNYFLIVFETTFLHTESISDHIFTSDPCLFVLTFPGATIHIEYNGKGEKSIDD